MVAGLLTAAVAVGVGQLVSGFSARQGAPAVAVGQAAIDLAPSGVKNFAISAFGPDDKTVLLGGILVVLAVFAAVIGALAMRRLAYGYAGLVVFAALGLAAALTRPDATAAYAVPTFIGALAGAFTLNRLIHAAQEAAGTAVSLRSPPARRSVEPSSGPAGSDTSAAGAGVTDTAAFGRDASGSIPPGPPAPRHYSSAEPETSGPATGPAEGQAGTGDAASGTAQADTASGSAQADTAPAEANDAENTETAAESGTHPAEADGAADDGTAVPTAEPEAEPATEPGAQPATEPGAQPGPESATQPGAEPGGSRPWASRPVPDFSEPVPDYFEPVPDAANGQPPSGAGPWRRPAWISRAASPAETWTYQPLSRPGRRRFLIGSGVAALTAAAAGFAGRELNARQSVTEARSAIHFPTPAEPAPPLPAGTDFHLPGLSSFITPDNTFYRVDTAIVLPEVAPQTWTLHIHGLVERELTINFSELLRRPLIEHYVTLTCVSNPVAGPYVGNAKWLGASLADLIREARPKAGASQLLCTSVDGFTSGTPLQIVLDGREALLAVAMNGTALPVAHGFPARMVVPGLYGYVSATKWVTDIKVTTFESETAYWVQRGWSQQAPIKTESRIDIPFGGATVSPGRTAVAGVAWAQHRGIDAVHVRVDAGPWHEAKLATVPGIDTWRQWLWYWDATPGNHTLEARATDATGYTQTAVQAPTEPNGATGYPANSVTVRS